MEFTGQFAGLELNHGKVRCEIIMAVTETGRKIIVETLKKSKIFSALSEKELIQISPLFEKLDFKDGEYIFMEDDPSDWLYIVTRKRVKIIKHTLPGKDVILEIKSPGEIFCCATVLDNKPYPESAQAKEAASVIRIRRAKLLKVIDMHPVLKVGITEYLNEKLLDAYEMFKNLSTEIVERRIASLLLQLAEKAGIEDSVYKKIDFALTRQEIADMVGTTQETCIRTMSKFQKLGMVTSSRSRILVKTDILKEFLG